MLLRCSRVSARTSKIVKLILIVIYSANGDMQQIRPFWNLLQRSNGCFRRTARVVCQNSNCSLGNLLYLVSRYVNRCLKNKAKNCKKGLGVNFHHCFLVSSEHSIAESNKKKFALPT